MRTQFSSLENQWGRSKHECYFCHPELYPRMPDFHTICARCGALIETPGVDDPKNNAMYVCPDCEEDLALDEMMGGK